LKELYDAFELASEQPLSPSDLPHNSVFLKVGCHISSGSFLLRTKEGSTFKELISSQFQELELSLKQYSQSSSVGLLVNDLTVVERSKLTPIELIRAKRKPKEER
jgi:hypothetical protein